MKKTDLNLIVMELKNNMDKKGIKVFYSISECNNNLYLDVKFNYRGYNRAFTLVADDDIINSLSSITEDFFRYYDRVNLQKTLNEILDSSTDKFNTLKNIVKKFSKDYSICIPYDLLGMLELTRANAKTITCLDSLDNKVYMDKKILDSLYIKNDTLRVYEK